MGGDPARGLQTARCQGVEGDAGADRPTRFWDAAARVKEQSVTEVPEEFYEGSKDEALSRLPRDAGDWQVVGLVLALGADILTADRDFFGCGVATWTADTLIAQLKRRDQWPFS